MEYEHFLITRFNLKKNDWTKDKNSKEILSDVWLCKRIELFKKYCLPSVLSQSNKNFKWLIFFDSNITPSLDVLLREISEYDFIEPIYVSEYSDFQNGLSDFIKTRLNFKTSYVLTSRLDNDDALHQNFINHIQSNIEVNDKDTVLHFPYGFCLNLDPLKLSSIYYPLNQFVSLFELKNANNPLKTVFFKEHDSWGKNFSIKPILSKESWLQVIHEQNMVNEFRGKPIRSKYLKGFNILHSDYHWSYDCKVALRKLLHKLNRKSF